MSELPKLAKRKPEEEKIECSRQITGKLVKIAELKGHIDRVWCAAWSPSGMALATCGGDKQIRIWAKQGENQFVCTQELDGVHSRTVRSLAWSPNGKMLASCSFDGLAAVWENQDGQFECIATLEGHDNEVKGIAWSASGALLATCSRDKSVWLWSAEEDDGGYGFSQKRGGSVGADASYECRSVLQGHTQDVKAVRWHPHDEMLISASYDNAIKVWREEGDDWYCTETLNGHSSTVWSVAFNESGSRFASVSDDLSLAIWERAASASSAGPAIASTTATAAWKCVAKVGGHHTRTIYCVDWSRSKGSMSSAKKGKGKKEKDEKEKDKESASTPDTSLIATCGGDDCIFIFRLRNARDDAKSGKDTASAASAATAMDTSSDHKSTATPSSSGSTSASASPLVVVGVIERAHDGDVNCVAWCPSDPTLLASAGDDAVVNIWKWTEA